MSRKTWYKTTLVATLLLIAAVAMGLASAGCGSSANADSDTLKLAQTDDGKSFTVKTGDTIQVVIPGNPTTGYEWAAALADADAALLQQLGDPVYAPDSTGEAVVGSGGVYTFTFKAVGEGQAVLKLAYARSFETVEPIQTFTVTLTIK
jgi:predicted secreted protein